jgi:hypothetical protein
MNQDTETLMFGVVDRVEQAIRDRDCPAVVAVQGDRVLVLSDYDYLRDRDTAVAFEERAAAEAREIHAVRFVLAVPQVWLSTEGDLQARAVSNLPLREGEREVIAWMSYDTGAGIDYGHTPYVRRPNGTPVFDDPEIFTAPVRPYEIYPGRHLLRTLLDGEDGPPGDA